MTIRLSEANSLACFFHDDRLVHETVRDREATLLPEMSPPSEDVPVQQRYVHVRPSAAVRELARVPQKMGNDLDLR